MHATILLALLALAAPPAPTPLRAAREAPGLRLGPRNTLKLQLAGGVVVDSNPANVPFTQYAALLRGRPTTNLATPGWGVFVAPLLGWKLERPHHTAELQASARLWSMAFVAQGGPTLPVGIPPPNPMPRWWPVLRLALDAQASGAVTLRLTRQQQATTRLQLLRTTAPVPELLGAMVGRTSVGGTQDWSWLSRRRLWTLGAMVGARVDVLDTLTADARTWRPPSTKAVPPVYVGGVGANTTLSAQRNLGRTAAVYGRVLAGVAAFRDGVRWTAFSAPVSAVVGFGDAWRMGLRLKVEGGIWIPNPVCPSPWGNNCTLAWSGPALRGLTADARRVAPWLGYAPLPVGLIQLDQQTGRRWLWTLRAVMDARPSFLYALVHEKRVEGAWTAQWTPTLQSRLSAAVAWLNYGAAFNPDASRLPHPAGLGPLLVRALDGAGRQDGMGFLDGSVRWLVTPWLVLAAQQSFWTVVTNVQVQRADGAWENPGLLRSLTAASAQLQW